MTLALVWWQGCCGALVVGVVLLVAFVVVVNWLMPDVDPCKGDPQAKRLLEQLMEGQWEETHRVLSGLRGEWDDLGFYVDALSEGLKDESECPAVAEWVQRRDPIATPHLFGGVLHIKWAWDLRGDGTADTVSEEGWEGFGAHLAAAEEQLSRAATLDPTDPTPLAWLVKSAMGLSLGVDEARARFDAAIERDPHHCGAHQALLSQLCGKWGGSNEAMFEFARAAVEAAPDGHRLHSLIATAHVERWLAHAFEDDHVGFENYWRRQEVRDEIKGAYVKSVGSREYQQTKMAAADANLFAYCFWKIGNRQLAGKLFTMIGDRIDTYPWCYEGDVSQVNTFNNAKKEVLG